MRAREKGWDVWGETCTQYFFVDYTFLERPDFEGAKYVYTPPPRDKANQDVLWDAVRRDMLSRDLDRPLRVPLGRAEDARPRRLLEDPERRARAREPAAHDPPLRRRARAGSALNRMVELLCTNPAKLFGLYPRKGTIAVGSDADIVVFDPEKRHTITAANQQSRSDYNLYEGTEVVGDVETVLLRGQRDRRGRRGGRQARRRPVRAAGAVRRAAAPRPERMAPSHRP